MSILLCVLLSGLVHLASGQDVIVSPACRRRTNEDPDCSAANSGPCFIRRTSDPTFALLPDPAPNSRSCYRTCYTPDDPNPPQCEVNRIPFENNTLVRPRGPVPVNSTAYSNFRIFSPNFVQMREYLDNEICIYHLACSEEDSVMTITIDSHSLEDATVCPGLPEPQCTDRVTLRLPFGLECTTCGSGPLSCMEVPNAPQLPSLLPFDGNASIVVRFQSNRRGRFRGFQFEAQCVRRSFYLADGCVEVTVAKKRKRSDEMNGIFRSGYRERRSHYRLVHIEVPVGTAVSYSDYTVRVFRGDVWLYKFRNTLYFQVYNFAEGFQTYRQSAPEGRIFPGFGLLKIGRGIIQFIQTSVKTEFLPTQNETDLIMSLQQRIVGAINQPDIDISDPDDDPAQDIPVEPPVLDIAELDRVARMFANACNGLLRATCCAYQQFFFPEGPEPDCFAGLETP